MGQFNLFVVSAVDLVPHETIDVLAGAPHVPINLLHGVLTIDALSMARVDQTGELMQFVAFQEANVHQVDQCAAIL